MAESEAQSVRAGTRVRNRRKQYLDTHPEYFSSDLESADPLLYDRLVRRWASEAEREAERREKGYSGMLEADLNRSEARLEAVRRGAKLEFRKGEGGGMVADELDEELPAGEARTKEGDSMRWKREMELRFVAGRDGDFDYAAVDNDESLDDTAQRRRDLEEDYFQSEEPAFELPADQLTGETGVQDF